MKPIWPDLSRIDELRLEATIVDDVQRTAAALGAPVLVTGAFARDLHLLHGLGVETGRKTEDIDFDVASARMLGYDLGTMLDEAARSSVIDMVGAHLAPDSSPSLAIEMQPYEPERALARLRALRDGLRDVRRG